MLAWYHDLRAATSRCRGLRAVIDSPAVGLLDGKVAVVTGTGRGLGRSHAIALAAAGAPVVVHDFDVAGATVDTIQSAGGRAAAADDSDVSTLDGAERSCAARSTSSAGSTSS